MGSDYYPVSGNIVNSKVYKLKGMCITFTEFSFYRYSQEYSFLGKNMLSPKIKKNILALKIEKKNLASFILFQNEIAEEWCYS